MKNFKVNILTGLFCLLVLAVFLLVPILVVNHLDNKSVEETPKVLDYHKLYLQERAEKQELQRKYSELNRKNIQLEIQMRNNKKKLMNLEEMTNDAKELMKEESEKEKALMLQNFLYAVDKNLNLD